MALERAPYACLVVDGRLSDVFKAVVGHVEPGWLLSVLAAPAGGPPDRPTTPARPGAQP